MRIVELLQAIRKYDEHKEELRAAEEQMESVRRILGAKWGMDETGFFHVPLFKTDESYLIKSISRLLKAHYAFEDLFVDYELELMRERTATRARIRSEIAQKRIENDRIKAELNNG